MKSGALIAGLLIFLLAACTEDNSPVFFEDTDKFQQLKNNYQLYTQHYAEPDIAYDLLKTIKSQAEELESDEYLAKYYIGYGYLKKIDMHFDEAVAALFKALDLYQGLGDSLYQAKVLNNIGNIYRLAYLPQEALECFDKAEKIYIKTSNIEKLPGLYKNIGLTFLDSGSFDLAEKYIKSGMEISVKNNLNEWVHSFYNLYGEFYFRKKEYDAARLNFFYSLELIPDDDKLQKAFLYGNIGETFLSVGELDSAEAWFIKSLQLKSEVEGADTKPTLNYMGKVELKRGNYNKAVRYFDEVVQLSRHDVIDVELDEAIEHLKWIYRENPSLRNDETFNRSLDYLDISQKGKKVLAETQHELNILYTQYSVKKGYNEYIFENN